MCARVFFQVCPGGAPCSAEVIGRIKQTAQWAAKIATDGAFHGLLQQVMCPAGSAWLDGWMGRRGAGEFFHSLDLFCC
jgi:hypothetical protein